MGNNLAILPPQKEIENRIFTIRSMQVMIDKDLAEMYGVETKVLNQAVKRNLERFPDSFRSQLTETELNSSRITSIQSVFSSGDSSRSQIVTLKSQSKNKSLKRGQNIKYLPYAFTEQGVAMLSAVLRSETAVKVSIQIMNAFIEMRKLLLGNAALFQRLDKIELKQIMTDQKFEQIFKALENKGQQPDTGFFFEGQVFDAYIFVTNLIKRAEKNIILIDNYIDETVLTLFTKRKKSVGATIFTKQINKQLHLDIQKYNDQYPVVEVKIYANSHDRFLIIDNKELYHIGASLKDLGKKWFGFSRMDSLTKEVLLKLK